VEALINVSTLVFLFPLALFCNSLY